MTEAEVLIAIGLFVAGVVIAVGIAQFLWRIGFVSFVGRRIIAPAIVSTIVGVALIVITGQPEAGVGGGIAISLITLALGGGDAA